MSTLNLTLIKNKTDHMPSIADGGRIPYQILAMDSEGHIVRGILYTTQAILEHLLNSEQILGFQHKECYDEQKKSPTWTSSFI